VADAGRSRRAFGVETIEIDLPPLAGALSRRLHDAGVPTTPARSADLTRALALVRPMTRRRVYWTARAVLVSDPSQVAAFDAVFWSVFGDRPGHEAVRPDEAPTGPAPADDRPRSEGATARGDSARREPRGGGRAAAGASTCGARCAPACGRAATRSGSPAAAAASSAAGS
jgi:uncharacterized protein with von Willebrand factor type A (vWA) domain